MTETVRDTVVEFSADSATIRALLECDSLGQVRLRELLDYRAGERVQPPQLLLRDNILTAKTQVDSLSIYLTWQERHERVVSREEQSETVVVEVNRLTRWQSFWVQTGKILLALVTLILLGRWAGAKLKLLGRRFKE